MNSIMNSDNMFWLFVLNDEWLVLHENFLWTLNDKMNVK
jgi:hypothetical protein